MDVKVLKIILLIIVALIVAYVVFVVAPAFLLLYLFVSMWLGLLGGKRARRH